MRTLTLPLILVASLGLTVPAPAQDLKNVIGGIADTLLQQELDRNAYVAAQDANSVSAYRDYLTKFPRGAYRTNAQQALARLGAPVAGSPEATSQVEARLGITVSQKVAVQRELTRLGYRTYGADGVWGRNTRTAIANWQRDRGDRVTGYVTGPQLEVLLRSRVVTSTDNSNGPGPAETEARLRLTRSQRTEIQRQLTGIGYDAGVADGLWGSRTRAALKAWQRANRKDQTGYVTAAQIDQIAAQAGNASPSRSDATGAALEERLLSLSLAERSDLQRRLARLGYDPTQADGTFGPGTRQAIAAWQRDEGEAATGYLTADQVRTIRAETGG